MATERHRRHRLDRRCARTNPGNTVVLPLLLLILLWPARRVSNTAFELVFHTGDIWLLHPGVSNGFAGGPPPAHVSPDSCSEYQYHEAKDGTDLRTLSVPAQASITEV